MKRIVALVMTILLLLAAMPVLAEDAQNVDNADSDGMKLNQVVILSRHNIRSPIVTRNSVLEEITPHQWFDWTSAPSELSLRGAMLETTMGQYFRLWLESEGLFPENYRPEVGAVRFYANALQRTRATAHYFSAGLLPVVDVAVEQHVEYNTVDPVFVPLLTFMTDEYEADVRREVSLLGGIVGMRGISAGLHGAMEMLMDVVDMEDSAAYQSGKYGNFLEDEYQLLLEVGKEANLAGPIKLANTLIDSLTLQYYEEPDELKAAFGHKLTLDDWRYMHTIADTYSDMLFATPRSSIRRSTQRAGSSPSSVVTIPPSPVRWPRWAWRITCCPKPLSSIHPSAASWSSSAGWTVRTRNGTTSAWSTRASISFAPSLR